MKKEVAKMIRHNACLKLGNHEYKFLQRDRDDELFECIHCREWRTFPLGTYKYAEFDSQLFTEDLQGIPYRFVKPTETEEVI